MRKITKKGLKSAIVEKDVEGLIRAEVTHYTGAEWASPHNCDGFGQWGNVRLLLEVKLDQDFTQRKPVCALLGQCLGYQKRFEEEGDEVPNVIMVADKDECFLVPVNTMRQYLDMKIDWSFAPSKGNLQLTHALLSSLTTLPWVYNLDACRDFSAIVEQAEQLAEVGQHTVRASVDNLPTLFGHWVSRVFKASKKDDMSPPQKVQVFLDCLFNPEDTYLHPKKASLLITPSASEPVKVNGDQFKSFFAQFEQGYTPKEVTSFLSMKDRLIEDDARRRQGAFFTPRLWVDEAHKEVSAALGEDWRKDCVVWDCASGTGNLTRDYHDWGCLISTTAEASDVEDMRRNLWGGNVGQYDFLNDGAQSPFFPEGHINTIPPQVDKALKAQAAAGNRLVFFINPPYGTAGIKGSSSRAGVAQTVVNGEMKAAKLGSPSQQLYAQFMFRCRKVAEDYGFADYTVALYSKPTFVSSGSYRRFRDWWYGSHEYKGGFLFQASHFADVSGAWGISFTVWNSGGVTSNTADLPLRLTDECDFAVVTKEIKMVYNSDGRQASKWVREPIKGLKGADAPQMKSGLVLATDGVGRTGSLGFWANHSNSLQYSSQLVFLLASAYSPGLRNGGGPLYPANWRRAVALYGARKLVKGNWINDKDEYLVPDTALPGYKQWVDDCHVYALLHTSNNCTAMRDVQYKGKSWRVKNNWFWMTRLDAMKKLNTSGTLAMYRDAEQEQEDSYFATVLPNLALSGEAREVMRLLRELWEKSLPLRGMFYEMRAVTAKDPDLHLMTHDAGFYQLKHLWRDHFRIEFDALKDAHKALAAKLHPGVYTYGFLKK